MGACGFFAVRRVMDTPAPAARPQIAEAPNPTLNAVPPPPPKAESTPLPQVEIPTTAGIPAKDHDAAAELSNKINARQPLGTQDLRTAEDLYGRYASEPKLKTLLSVSLLTLADQERSQRRLSEAAGYVRRAVALGDEDARARVALMNLLLEAADWTGAEAAARDALRLLPRDPIVIEGLAYALFRQDRNREAAEHFKTVADMGGSATARGYLERIQKNLSDERGMTEQRLSHFHVRYDGGEHEEVGREILRALERYYATLTATFDHQIPEPVPVILFTQQGYYDASGAPAWSGGVFDHTDGRIRVPIGGLTSALTPDMEDTLIHELTHAFINDRSHVLAPREVHEGMAQYMEGKRLADGLDERQMRALADGRIGGVGGFYLTALSFAEYLMALRGQGGVNDVLKAMADTGSVDDAFRQVYGQDYAGTRQIWWNHFRQQYGS
jgi:tetratricopeptide (TPR) repeat protein